MSGSGPLLEARDLAKHYPLRTGPFSRNRGVVKAVDGVCFSIAGGETLALVGESGSGKSTIGRLVLRLEEPTAGRVLFDGRDLTAMGSQELRSLRREMQIVFQDPFGSLNPRLTVGGAIEEALRVHRIAPGREGERVRELLELVGLKGEDRRRYPHEFSGGQRQRIGIARSLAVEPRLLVADEPVSALDVSIQAQIVNLLLTLKEKLGLSYLLISHGLAVVRHASDRTAVLYLGKIVEKGPTEALYREPFHPYTKALIAATPLPDPARRGRRAVLGGEIPSAARPPAGCPFHPRCPEAFPPCRTDPPARFEPAPGRSVNCHLFDPSGGS
ncbi:MAG: oligopeptide/dipeptide ABC transporter ATP-binding protein [Candidatus Eisenbacteria bacterium]